MRAEWLPVTLRRMAQNGEIIDGIFKPSVGGLLGSSAFGVTWKGPISLFYRMSKRQIVQTI